MKAQKTFLSTISSLLVALAAAQASTWHVDAKGVSGNGGTGPADALPSLQAAIDRAADGDLILVAEGEYAPVSVASSRSLTIRSTGGPENTLLAGDGTTRCATFADETGAAAWNVTLEGFALEGGVDASDAGGGGVFGGNLVNCILRDNAAVRGGAASGSRLENCLLTGNAATLLGGGAFDSELVNCTVVGNHADGTGGGTAGCELANCIVRANDSPDGADAAGCFATHSCTTPLLEGEGNFDADPLFADAETDNWRLAAGSPCLDAGDAGFCTVDTDLAGNARLAGSGVDLGACEGAADPAATPKGVPARTVQMVTIAFDANGGTCDPARMAFPVGSTYLELPTPTRPGYLCTGWFTAAKGGSLITADTVVSATHETFYAHWARAVTISFDPNGGKCDTKKMTFPAGATYSGFPRPTRSGFLYAGWYTAAKGGTRITGKTVVSTSHKKFYAHWDRAVTVAFDANGGTCETNKMTVRVGAKYSTLPRPARTNYLFTGWYTAAKGGTRITANTVAAASHKKFYAQWARAVTVAFDATGGTCTPEEKTFRVGAKFSNLPKPTHPEHLFIGWYTAAEGGTRVTTNTVVAASHKTLFAHWRHTVTVSFDPNGGSCAEQQRKYGIPLPYGSFPSATRSGYALAGWFTPDGTQVKTNSPATAEWTNLVAHWNQNLGIHPVGDSMTYGVRTRNNPLLNGASASAVAKIGNQGWRGYLKKTLVPWGKTLGRAVVFLGKHPQSSYKGNVPHDGYCGEYASAYAANHKSACAVQADVQIVFLGMNDALAISRKSNPASHIAALERGYGSVLSALHAGSGTPLTILVTEPRVTSLITKRNKVYNPTAINRVIAKYINPFVRSQKGAAILILDIESLYSNASYTDDGFHLSDAGNKVLAARLAKLVEEFWEGE